FDSKGANRGTGRDVVELSREEWGGFLPKEKARVGDTWPLPEATAAKLLRLAYPPVAYWNAKFGKVEVGKLDVTVTAVGKNAVALRLSGELGLLYPNVNKPDVDGKVTAKLIGVGHVDPEKKALTNLEVVTEGGTYLQHWQGKPRTSPVSVTIELEP